MNTEATPRRLVADLPGRDERETRVSSWRFDVSCRYRQVVVTIRLLPLLLTVFVSASNPAAAVPLSINEAFGPVNLLAVKLSPDGKWLAALAGSDRGTAVVLIDADTLEIKPIVGPSARDNAPLSIHWISSEMLAVNYRTQFRVFRTSGEHRYRRYGRYLGNAAPAADGSKQIIARQDSEDGYIDLVNLRSGESILTNWDLPGTPMHWVFDEAGIPRVATTFSTAFWSDQTTLTHWYRASINDKWQKLADFAFLDDIWLPIYLMKDGKSLAVYGREGRDTGAYFRYDLKERRIGEMLAGHPTQDIIVGRSDGDERFDRAVTYGMKPEIYWFDSQWEGLQRAVDSSLPGRINFLSGNSKGRILVFSYADIDPGRWYILDGATKKMREVEAAMPNIDPRKMRPKSIVRYASLDGLSIPAYLTLPKEHGTPQPAIVLVHGGPVLRDGWDWNAEVQLLASHGYVVFQPQFRGSSGFGKRFMEAGYRQWGLAMQDDITAGTRWLIDQGIADPKRICIYGASYGGYSAMWGMAHTPELFRCGASFAGVSDIELMLKDDSDRNESALGRLYQQSRIGHLKTNKQKFEDVSPLRNAALIRAPVFIAHGTLDARVPIEHSEKMVAALRKNGKEVEWLKLEGEGHGFAWQATQHRFYGDLLKFFEKHIGHTAQSATGPD